MHSRDSVAVETITSHLFAPTQVPPGPDKVSVLAARYAAKINLWHPDDAPLGGPTNVAMPIRLIPRGAFDAKLIESDTYDEADQWPS